MFLVRRILANRHTQTRDDAGGALCAALAAENEPRWEVRRARRVREGETARGG